MNGNIENLAHGTMTTIARGDVDVMVYDTKDPIQNQVILIERDGKAVVIELPCFEANIAELTGYLKDAGIEVVAKLVSYHAAGSTFLPEVPSYLTESAVKYNTDGEGAGLIGNFQKIFGDAFDASIQNSGKDLRGGKVTFAGIDLVIVPNGDAYEVEIPQANAVYMHMLGHDCHSIVAGAAHADAIAANLQQYLDRGFDLFLSAHYAPETVEDVRTKIAYLGMLKEVAAESKDAADFTAKVNARCPGYSGDNYLGMTAGFFFPQRTGTGAGRPAP